jgi:hypothetical protein
MDPVDKLSCPKDAECTAPIRTPGMRNLFSSEFIAHNSQLTMERLTVSVTPDQGSETGQTRQCQGEAGGFGNDDAFAEPEITA